MSDYLLEARGLHKTYDGGAQSVTVLRGVDFAMRPGELIGVYGASGAGKSTLLHVLGGLDAPSRGTVSFLGRSLTSRNEADIARMRNRHIGFVFQFYHLLSEFTAVENVMIPCVIGGAGRKEARQRGLEALDQVGLMHRADIVRPSSPAGNNSGWRLPAPW